MTDSTQLADQFLYQCAVKTVRPVKISSSKRVIDVSDIQGGYTSGIITLDAGTAFNGSNGFSERWIHRPTVYYHYEEQWSKRYDNCCQPARYWAQMRCLECRR